MCVIKKGNIMQTSFKLWEGPSKYNKNTISVIITNVDGSSHNPKTKRMSQVWFLPTDVKPWEAVKPPGKNEAVCGDCYLRPTKYKFARINIPSCYVARRAYQAPTSVWKASINKDIQINDFLNIFQKYPFPIRWGAYGDPAMIPKDVFERVHFESPKWLGKKTHTAYTHQHDKRFAFWLKKYAMASVETIDDAERFWSLGWRTFRITDQQEASKYEIVCPHITREVSCQQCCLCDGKRSKNDNRKSITIPRH
jgi:hypothetical protein